MSRIRKKLRESVLIVVLRVPGGQAGLMSFKNILPFKSFVFCPRDDGGRNIKAAGC